MGTCRPAARQPAVGDGGRTVVTPLMQWPVMIPPPDQGGTRRLTAAYAGVISGACSSR
jgi:hypothetical protein